MLKHVLLTGAMLISVPALAQTAPSGDQTKPAAPTTSTTAPKTATPPAPTTPQPADPAAPAANPATAAMPAPPADPAAAAAAPAPATPADPAAPATADATAPVAPAAAAPSPGAQIADVVGKEFPSYDKNSDGKLSKTEFGAWMFALRKANDPALKDDAANKTYVAGAFTTADTDKSKTVSKDELTNYLIQGQAAATKPS